MDLSDRMSVKEACAYLHVSSKTIYRWIDSGKLPAIKIGLQLFIKRDAVESIASGRGVYIDNLIQRIDNLEQRLAELEGNAQSSPTPHAAQPPPTTHTEQAKPSVAHSGAIPEELPEGTVTLRELATEFGVNRSTLYEQIVKYGLEHISIPLATLGKPGAGDERFFTPTQAQAVRDWRATRPKRRRESGDD